ncbi:arsenic transporter [Xanthomonas theicola]|uniref:Arsenic transporter n=1 Tax=Xanthomonas theicola TaxID=56464 RepID=A0A2S6ZKL0_9XANT|nr:arsenic transporter [Xanthomonas theicola]PPT92736.1 arsenic transporter [Xanthomonas theicola]QNH24343.1 arsenic transporter [Xanthomonas theicola]
MTSGHAANLATWSICALATAGVITRPFKLSEAWWAVGGALLLLAFGLMPAAGAWQAVLKGHDVYLFLIGMLLLSETARAEGLFDWVAMQAVNLAKGSTRRLFALVFGFGIVVTALLSNDATAVVLTPAVYAAARKAGAKPLPMLFACALIANAASFVLPISNPANLVMYGGQMPTLGTWLAAFALPSLLAIGVTFAMLRWTERKDLAGRCAARVDTVPLGRGGAVALAGILATAALLVGVSALGLDLGLPTCLAGLATLGAVCLGGRQSPLPMARAVSWAVLPLVAGLFVLVAALVRTGVVGSLAQALASAAAQSPLATAGAAGALLALASNLMNNLPAGLIASTTLAQAQPPQLVVDTLLIGVDLGPNLSVTGSLATILWLTAIRREGEDVGFWRFLKVGALVMPPALLCALGARLLLG